MKDFNLFVIGLILGVIIGVYFPQNKQPPPVKLKQLYRIDGEDYKPVNVLGCIHLQTYRKSIHAWDLCRNEIHNGIR